MSKETRSLTLAVLTEGIIRDVRFAVRSLARNPVFAIVAVLTLGLGIGTCTGMFSVVYGVLLKPLPYRDPVQLAVVQAEQDFNGARLPVRAYFPLPALRAWPSEVPSLESVAFYSESTGSLAGSGGSEIVPMATVSDSFFSLLGGEFLLGRPLGGADDAHAVVISERLWRQRYAASHAAVGQSLTLNSQSVTIAGVAASTFQWPSPQTDIWALAGFSREGGFTPIARLKTGASIARANEDLTVIANTLGREIPRAFGGVRLKAIRLQDQLVGTTRPALLVLSASAGLVLVLACANVMNLLLARGVSRSREIAVRSALGASRGRLIRHALAESAVLTAAGAVVGMILATLSVGILKRWPPAGLSRLDAIGIDHTVMIFAGVVSLLTALAMGILPALRSQGFSVMLKSGRNGNFGSPRVRLALRAVMVAQLAISVVLLVGAMLLGRSLFQLMHSELGVTTDRVATAYLQLAHDRQLTGNRQVELVNRVIERIGGIPNVSAVGAGTSRPPDSSQVRLTLRRPGEASASFQAAAVPVTPGYFEALGIRLVSGRLFTNADDMATLPVVIMSAGTARLLFDDEAPIGRTISLPVLRDGKTASAEMTVVGITANVRYAGLDQLADAVVYRPFAQQPWASTYLVARAPNLAAAMSQFRREIAAIDPQISVSEIMTLDSAIAKAAAQPRFRALLLTAFAALAALIAGVGLYGVIAYSVSQRTAEIGVRIAVGGSHRQILKMFLSEGLALAVTGSLVGLAAAYGVSRALAGLLYAIAPTDAISFSLAAGGAMIVAVFASWVPARRASRVDPLIALRSE